MFTKAITRLPATNFAAGLTTVDLGAPDYELTLRQHCAYRSALTACGLEVTVLPADERFPDSAFVEDAAIMLPGAAILARPGAPSRSGEVEAICEVLKQAGLALDAIMAPGTLDGGDICEVGNHFLIGISARTNEEGAAQLQHLLARYGCTAACIDIRSVAGILHLKSGLAYLGENRLAVIEALADHPALAAYHKVLVPSGEEYAANCVLVNDFVLFPAGYPLLASRLRELGMRLVELEMSEFAKMDGGLSCLSLRF